MCSLTPSHFADEDEGNEAPLTLEEDIRRRTRAFNEQLRAHPEDVELWRKYIAFQVSLCK